METSFLQVAGTSDADHAMPVIARSNAPRGLGLVRPLRRACPVCHSKSGVALGQLKYALFADSSLADKFEVVCCAGCGYVSCDTPSTQVDFDRFYERYYYSTAYVAHEIPPEEDRYFVDVIETISSFLTDERDTIFDVGCGIGGLLRKCRVLGYQNLFAVDPSPSCVDLLTQAGFQAALGSVLDIPFTNIEPDVLVLSHIVEHLVDMRQSLDRVRQRLDRGGVVYVEVPDAALYEEHCPGLPLQFFYLQHVVHFDEKQLDNLLHANGFRKLRGGRRVRDENCFATPAVWGVYERGTDTSVAVVPDFGLATAIKAWFDTSSLDPDDSFAALAKSGRRVYVWGVGTHVQLMLGMSPLRDCNVICCVDQDPKLQRQTIEGIRIEPPSVLREAADDDTIVVGSLVHRQAMTAQLRSEMRFGGEILTFCRLGSERSQT